jgi:uncharacterized protein YbjT (DUF2867 family)
MNRRSQEPTLVLGGTGKIGRRVVDRLAARGLPVRIGSRSGDPRFDWEDRSTWDPVLEGVGSAYVSHYWDAIPGAAETLGLFADLAVESGVPRLVLLSGRGEEEAERAERAVRDSGAELTVLRSTWFAQNFSEDYWQEQVQAGEVALPAADTPEPFVDADDIADVAVAALTDHYLRRRRLRWRRARGRRRRCALSAIPRRRLRRRRPPTPGRRSPETRDDLRGSVEHCSRHVPRRSERVAVAVREQFVDDRRRLSPAGH